MRHPGGEAHTRRMLELAALAPGARVLDRGTGGLGTALGSGNRWVLGRDERWG